MNAVPNFLADFADRYAADPRAACKAWFGQARYGLFLHYGATGVLSCALQTDGVS